MAISYPLSTPTTSGQQSIRITANSVVAVSRSPFTRAIQAQVHQGQWWDLQVTIMSGQREDIEPWTAFLMKLNGQEGTFLLGDDVNSNPRGAADGAPLIDGALQVGNEIDIKGASLGTTNYLMEGDWIGFNQLTIPRLYKVLEDVDSDGSGDLTVTIWPNVNSATSPANGAAVAMQSPKGMFRLAGNAMPYAIRRGTVYELSFRAISEV